MTEHEAMYRLSRWVVVENMLTIVSTVALILGLYWMGAGGWSALGALLCANLNTWKDKSCREDHPEEG